MNTDLSTTPQKKLSTNIQSGLKKVLIVEDEADAADIFAQLVRTIPICEAEAVKDGLEALERCKTKKYDLILLDIVMPNLDGVETLTRIKSDANTYGSPKIYMLTNIGGDASVSDSLRLGADGYFLKSTTEPEDLIKKIKEILGYPV